MKGFYRQRLGQPGDCDQRHWKRRLRYDCRKVMVMEGRFIVIGNAAAVRIRKSVPAEKNRLLRPFGRNKKRFRNMESDVLDKEEQQEGSQHTLQRGSP